MFSFYSDSSVGKFLRGHVWISSGTRLLTEHNKNQLRHGSIKLTKIFFNIKDYFIMPGVNENIQFFYRYILPDCDFDDLTK